MNLLIILYFIIPKIDLVGFDGIATGIRFQDFIALIFFCKFFSKDDFINFRLFALIYIFINILSSYYNNSVINSVIGWIRLFEYYVIGYAIYKCFNVKNFKNLIYIEIFVISLQYFSILPNFDPGRGVILSSEYSGTFGTPAEFSYLLGLLCFFNLDRLSVLTTFFFIPIITSNGVKASVLLPLFNLYEKIIIDNKFKISLIFICAPLLIITYWVELDSIISFIRVISNYDFTSFDASYFKEKDFYFNDESLQQTLNLRVIKWGVAIHLFLSSNFLQILFGNGLYIVGGALDSGFIRFFYELGLIPALFFFLKFFDKNKRALIAVIFANLFFDAWISSVTAPVIMAIYLKSIYE